MARRPSSRPPSRNGPSARRQASRRAEPTRRVGLPAWGWGVLVVAVLGLLAVARSFAPGDRMQLRARAEAAAQAGDWGKSLELWRRINASSGATGLTYLGEGRACLALGRAAQAERALR